jgi:phosphoenolpyruvate phosphomutase
VSKATRFRQLLLSPRLEFLCEAHNGLSAKVVEEAGFAGIWASGLSLSAQFGVRDTNEASWTQVLEMLEFMSDATSVPILLDGDTGYGNFNNMRRLVRKLEQRGIAAVCIEDKLFPKTNSFIRGEAQPLADIDEFCGKIKAGKDAQEDADFSIIARVEAFIAGWGLEEALRRAEAYHAAGADGILIHSALRTAEEVLAFKREWGERCPVVIVPTKYYSTPTEVFRDFGFSIVIWANQLVRAAVTAMQRTARALRQDENLLSVEDQIAPIPEIFRLQGEDELAKAEQVYLPRRGGAARALVLAASRGSELGELTVDRPKAMIDIAGQPLLARIAAAYRQVGVKQVTVVRGYRGEAVDLPNLHLVDNDEYQETGELVSLHKGLKALAGSASDLIVSYGDVLFNKYIPEMLIDADDPLVVVVDSSWRTSVNRNRRADYASCSQPAGREAFYRRVTLRRVAEDLPLDAVDGEWMGFLKIRADALGRVVAAIETILSEPANRQEKVPALLNALIAQGHEVRVLYTSAHWLDIDSFDDVVNASLFAHA